ncbi:MAG: hypothetical protein H7A41_00895 [Chlamydiales bacterium]|nr:hypothetical protein [Chlamydiia bacterium]MCP5503688.1 hypothetical protein [Chlamydiales bacterium]
MSGVSGVGGSGQVPQQPPELPEQTETDLNQNQTDAINLFNDLTQVLTSLANEAKLGGKGHG